MQAQVQHLSFNKIPLLREALSRNDDWTSLSDRKERRRVQNRLYQRATRRRKNPEHVTPLRSKLEDVQQGHQIGELPKTADLVSKSTLSRLSFKSRNQILYKDFQTLINTIGDPRNRSLGPTYFPLSVDNLIPTVYTNIFRALLTNIILIRGDARVFDPCSPDYNPQPRESINAILSLPLPACAPPSLHPTTVQMSIPHPMWMDVLPMPSVRDALIMSWTRGLTGVTGKRRGGTECALALDILGPTNNNGCGGGCCKDEENRWDNMQGLIVWGDPWVPDNWEVTERFMRRWGWIMRGCQEQMLRATNRWRDVRGLEPLDWVEESIPEL